jgi:hypothetical protein
MLENFEIKDIEIIKKLVERKNDKNTKKKSVKKICLENGKFLF